GALTEYLFLDAVPVAISRVGGLSYIEADHLGTPRVAFNPATNTKEWVWDLLGKAFGENPAITLVAGKGVELRYPGQWQDSESGLHYNYFRDYEPAIGRYVESDPIGLRGGISTYSYVHGSPISKKDPKGLWSFGSSCDAAQRARISTAMMEVVSNYLAQCAGSFRSACSNCNCFYARHAIIFLSSAQFECDLPYKCAAASPVMGVVKIHPSVANGSDQLPGQCGCLASVVFHEGMHGGGAGMPAEQENEVRKQTRRCFSCASNRSLDGQPLSWQ
ncbi:MAG: RHS repeat-associated core domain-containing protein, partial [Rhodanobacteraceae bacterium]|nr:RHS repeat-associated core domain-containing protein [Rhodanobacteraceae bacterium]